MGNVSGKVGAGPGAFSDRRCLLFQVGLATGPYREWSAVGNVTNVSFANFVKRKNFRRLFIKQIW